MTEDKILEQIEEIFEENYELMQVTAGSYLADDIKRLALLQVIYYYRRMKQIAEKVTHAEVKLTLPDQKTPNGKTFTIEGVVDIVKENNDTWMYDIKTHDSIYIQANKELYEKQLNIYAYIWQNLRKERLDHTAIISTAFPPSLKRAIQSQNDQAIEFELNRWDPLMEMLHQEERVEITINDFAEVVDCIENREFSPPSIAKLKDRFEGTNTTFGTHICRNCDSRFSCEAFRGFIRETGQALKSNFEKYFDQLLPDTEQEDWINSHLSNDSFWDQTFIQLFEENEE